MTDPGPRHREEDTCQDYSCYEDVTYCDGSTSHNVYNTTSTYAHVCNGKVRSMDDIVVKNFFARRKKGEIFNNPCTRLEVEFSASSTASNSRVKKVLPCASGIKSAAGNCNRGLWPSYGHLPMRDFGELGLNEAVVTAGTQAWANVLKPEILTGEPIHDWEATWHMLRHPLSNYHQFLSRVHKKKSFRRSGLALGEFISGHWLQYRYGMQPLVLDLMAAFEAAVLPRFDFNRYTARGSSSVIPWDDNDTLSTTETYYNGTVARSIHQEGYVRAGVLYEHTLTTSDVWGLSAHNVLPLLWEIFPYSWMVDWFVNAGDFIAAFTPKAGVKVLSSWYTTYTEVLQKGELSSTPKTDPTYNVYGGPGFQNTIKTTRYTRTPHAPRGLTWKLQDLTFSKTKNLLHLGDGLALAGQYLASKYGGRDIKPWKPYKTRGRGLSHRGEYLLPQNPV